jgi:uncharacterized protein
MDNPVSDLPEAWRLAIRREIESQAYYSRLEQSTPDASLQALFRTLAEQETQHRQLLETEYRRRYETEIEQARERSGVFEHVAQSHAPALITWHDWDDEVFRLAQELDVPILLSISAVWCHWCHVMDQTTFADPEVAALIDAHFVAVRVDNDKRPDVNARYNMGGWPSVSFLTPDGEILSGGTYMTPTAFKDVLQHVSEYYRDNRETIQQRIADSQRQRSAASSWRPQVTRELNAQTAQEIFQTVTSEYDAQYGGFGRGQKFPQVDAIELALARYHRSGDLHALEVAVTTLRAMCEGGLYDSEMGGFFRYSTTRDWSVPHFEKMLEDNAHLLSACMHAYQITRHMLFHDTALGVVSYVGSTLYDPALGYFSGSQDADEQYYGLPKSERQKRAAPFIDKVAYTSWNALMASAYLDAWLLLERPELAQTALGVLRFLWQECWRPGQGMCHYWDGQSHLPGLLGDQAAMANALLDGYEYGANWDHVQQAEEVMRWVQQNLSSPSGAFRDRPAGPDLGLLKQADTPISENASAATALVRLSRLTGKQEYREWSQSALSAFADSYQRNGLFASGYALAVERLLTEPLRVVVVGSTEDLKTLQLLRAAREPYSYNRMLAAVDPTWEPERLKAMAYPAQPTPRAYACLGQTCTEPIADSAELVDVLQDMHQGSRGR